VVGIGPFVADAATIGRSRTPARWVNPSGFAGVIDPDVSLQQAGRAAAAIAFSCAQHGFIAQESRLAIAGKTPVIVRIATAMKSVRMTIANLGMMGAIPNCRPRLTSAREDIHSVVPPTRGGLPA
jgi:hypothetical protein